MVILIIIIINLKHLETLQVYWVNLFRRSIGSRSATSLAWQAPSRISRLFLEQTGTKSSAEFGDIHWWVRFCNRMILNSYFPRSTWETTKLIWNHQVIIFLMKSRLARFLLGFLPANGQVGNLEIVGNTESIHISMLEILLRILFVTFGLHPASPSSVAPPRPLRGSVSEPLGSWPEANPAWQSDMAMWNSHVRIAIISHPYSNGL